MPLYALSRGQKAKRRKAIRIKGKACPCMILSRGRKGKTSGSRLKACLPPYESTTGQALYGFEQGAR